MKNTAMQKRIGDEVLEFIDARRSLQLATLADDGFPYASYAPFARDDRSFFVLLSDIALHGVNLKQHTKASVLVIEDEGASEELYARVRVGYQVNAEELPVNSSQWLRGIECLAERHGERPRKLAELSDFRLFRLIPTRGRYVKGFGKAYTLAGGTLAGETIDHLREGHRPRESNSKEEAVA